MEEKKTVPGKMKKLVEEVVKTYEDQQGINYTETANLPVRDKIVYILSLLTEVIFPGFTGKKSVTEANIAYVVGDLLSQIQAELSEQIYRAYRHRCRMENCSGCDCHRLADEATDYLLEQIPRLREMLKDDVAASVEGDPAAKSFEEVVISYPGIVAITAYRIAHELYHKDVPLIPRIITECAHTKTGIDIHPGAEIGKHFFIDHGTGVVIGETTVIGNNVRIYQGATLGALSFRKDEKGKLVRGIKRHPTIEDNVTIYAEATILGDITIGENAVIGGNVWIKDSVPAGVTVIMSKPELIYMKRKKKNIEKKES